MTWIKSAELERLRTRERHAREDIRAAYAALNAGLTPSASLMSQLDPVAPLAEGVVHALKFERVRANKAEDERNTMRSQLDSARADLAEVRKVLDTANGGQMGVFVNYGVGGNVNAKVPSKSPVVLAAEHLAKRVSELSDKVKAQREELDAIERQRAQEAVDAEYAALPACPMHGNLQCPRCDKSISSPRLSDNADQNPQSAEMYGVITLSELVVQGAAVTVGPAKPKLPQHLVWRCTCSHTVRTKTRDAS
ncbi:Uncharacterized conserved protein [Mycobacteroides abscessus subsp. abscessus]|uniref:hypothetical protein n=1 Tax=Mycobacteroides abscessus TaxID=36809 RepID=UPI0009293CEA|nr:hypothetical protein [Mycobacteroides abscessus]SII19313.1 Uncharacterized conserved protein [Mycobacteroides abscessus subsp. abscessus]SII32649.1 Uncharacterized conserved protein [Mycobacteroides abscessus subsp. abscessus]SII64620.1 Uncharacterized conserved protein [Mycobacteroides abscessus subsp. abscessus]